MAPVFRTCHVGPPLQSQCPEEVACRTPDRSHPSEVTRIGFASMQICELNCLSMVISQPLFSSDLNSLCFSGWKEAYTFDHKDE